MSGFGEFSFRSRETALRRFRDEQFDLLIIGGGITGAAAARDAATRGLKVALVEKGDFASGTSSASSKLIHGGLRYLQNFELGLVFEALSERAHLLRTVPHMVRPLPFLLPVYQGDKNGKRILDLGLWLYDLLTLFRTPGFHKNLSRDQMLEAVPFLKKEGLQGGFRYYDASMWDDVLAVETLRAAHSLGAAIASYVEAVAPVWTEERITGFRVRDREKPMGKGELEIRAKRVVVCAGPWTDQVGLTLSAHWRKWLNPSKGVHLVFDAKKIPVSGALVMSHPTDGRISFVIPRPDFGQGVVIVGTTDGPTAPEPEKAVVEAADVEYLLDLLRRYFPSLELTTADILSAYVGVRPLLGSMKDQAGSEGQRQKSEPSTQSLQKVSREHHIDLGPGGTVIVAGGKYTTHRKMAEEIIDFTLKAWRQDVKKGKAPVLPPELGRSQTAQPINPRATGPALAQAREHAVREGLRVPEELYVRYGAEALAIMEIQSSGQVGKMGEDARDPEGFPFLAAQLRHNIRTGMVVHLDDFYFRRMPLFAARADHGKPWMETLARVWAEERGLGDAELKAEIERLQKEIDRRCAWRASV